MKTQTSTVIKNQKLSKPVCLVKRDDACTFGKEFPEYRHISKAEFTQAKRDFFKHLGDTVINNEHGVILSGIGYFANAVKNRRKVYFSWDEIFINDDDKQDVYKCSFFPHIFKNRMAKTWNFHLGVEYKYRMADLIRKGKKYKCHSFVLKKINNNGRVNIFGHTY